VLAPDSLVLVTGANGFVGSHLVEALLARGYRVRCLVRRSSDLSFIRHLDVEWAYGDLSDGDALAQACRDIHAVCHCAALTRASDEQTFMCINAAATEALARACLQAAPGLARFVFVSSVAAGGPAQSKEDPVSESSPARPITWYGKSKLAAETALLAMAGRLPVAIVRPAPVFGPRDRDFLPYFRLVKRGLELQVGGDPRWVSLIYVRDLTALIVRCLESEAAEGQVYYACGAALTRQEFTHAIAHALGKRTVSVALPLTLLTPIGLWSRIQARLTGRPGLLNDQRILDIKVRYWLFLGDKARQELGFAPEYDLDSALRETVRWYRENRWL
jgi:nucleoside-diphosphate-sugar epimerase